MRILIVGANTDYAIERFYLKYLNQISGISAQLFEAQNIFLSYYHKSIVNKLLFRCGYTKIYDKINISLRREVLHFKPDVVFVFKGMEVLPGTLKWLRKQGVKLVNYNPDHPFIRTSRGSWNANVYESINLYDLHFCYSKSVMKRINADYGIRTEFLPFGFDLEEDTFEKVKTVPEINKVCFIDNPDKIRASVIQYLLNHGIDVDVYGNNWKRYFPLKNNIGLNIYDAVYADKFWEIARKYRVQLNIFRPHNIGSHNMRTFEIPAVGGIQIAPDSDEHREFFEEGKEIFLYNNNEELLTKVKMLLAINNIEGNKIRTFAREKSLNADYSYKRRTFEVLNFLKSYFNEIKY